MVNLKSTIESSARELQSSWVIVSRGDPTFLPAKISQRWIEKSLLFRSLHDTSLLIPAREAAWEVLVRLKTHNIDADGKTDQNGIQIDFSIARHLALTAYCTTTWSIFDRLANICGRLSGIGEFGGNPKNNPKFCETFLDGKKEVLGFQTHPLLRDAYSWPIKVSYKVRNWLVHEGFSEGDVSLFQIDPNQGRFLLHEDAISHLFTCCNTENRRSDHCLNEADDPWLSKDLLKILQVYHGEIDMMYIALLQWTINSYVGQIRAFGSRELE